MKIAALASHLNLPDKALVEAGTSLGISSEGEVSSTDLERIRVFLEPNYALDQSKFDALKSMVLPPTPRLEEPTSGGATARPESTPGRLDLSGFGDLGRNIVTRRNRNDMILKRKTRNCGDTAGMVLDGLRNLSTIQTERDVTRDTVLKALAVPATEHEVWDITVHQHTFTLERYPDGSNMLIQSYQPGYNVQHWCGLDDPYLDNEDLADLPKTWFQPTDALVSDLGERIGRLYDSSREARAEVWKELPFNPQDALVDSERMDTLAFSANHITFDTAQPMDATLRGLTRAIDDLS